ncbi:hypothetical protein CRM22_010925, partial [Opisthorchis felineus]
DRLAVAAHTITMLFAIYSFQYFRPGDESVAYTCNSTLIYPTGDDFHMHFSTLSLFHEYTDLTFYSLDAPVNAKPTFRATAYFPLGGGYGLTRFGDYLFKNTMFSGLFANRFANFDSRLLRLGVLREEPMVIGGQLLSNGTLVNATGMSIDLLDILREKFNF